MFEVDALVKRFAGIEVLHGVSFVVRPGEILGYLGPNGSGKSTTIKIISGLIEPTAGRLRLHGQDVADDPTAFRRRLGYVPEEPHLYTHLTAPEYLRFVGRLRALPPAVLEDKITALLHLLDLAPASGALDVGVLEGHAAARPAWPLRCSTIPSCSSSTSRFPVSTSTRVSCFARCSRRSPRAAG